MSSDNTPLSTRRQLEALRRLGSIYANAALFGESRVIPCGSDYETANEVMQEAAKQALENVRATQAARRDLLATGFSVPDRWLTISTEQRVGKREDLKTDDGDTESVVVLSGVDSAALESVSSEIAAAIMRLEISPTTSIDHAASSHEVNHAVDDIDRIILRTMAKQPTNVWTDDALTADRTLRPPPSSAGVEKLAGPPRRTVGRSVYRGHRQGVEVSAEG